jgi:hypothetical protein
MEDQLEELSAVCSTVTQHNKQNRQKSKLINERIEIYLRE